MRRLERLYKSAIKDGDFKLALRAQRELMNLTCGGSEEPVDESDTAVALRGELEAIAAHLLPLQLLPPSFPLSEHACTAARLLSDHRLTPAAKAIDAERKAEAKP